jgi:multidrug transporter EmrE-like cation transporter
MLFHGQMILIAILSKIMFASPLNPNLIVGICIVAISIVMFNRGEQEILDAERRTSV